ncbi:hypothetical protein [Parasitella parasitica]|uniref:HMG box domain-containing protein n=1 Tax=Parasitella parasitica TaxID=35722 RepID=A0A0B7MVE6_9FUNG|nr:hypothetical protein [Parasitella parasitica]
MTQAQLLNSPHSQQQHQQQQQQPQQQPPHSNIKREQSTENVQKFNAAFSLDYSPFPLIRMAPPKLHQPTLAKELAPASSSSASLNAAINKKMTQPTRVTRPPNAYLLFNKEIRRILKDQDPAMKVADVSKEVGFRWKTLPKEQKDRYVDQANRLKEEQRALHPNSMYMRRSRAELLKASNSSRGSADQTAEPQSKRKRLKRDKMTTTPKHPLSAYMWYLTEVRPDVMRQYPGCNVGQISKVCADQWNVMSEEARLPWKSRAQADKDRYAREMQTFAIQNDHALGRGTRQKYRSAAAAAAANSATADIRTDTDVFMSPTTEPLLYGSAKSQSYLTAPTSPMSILHAALPMTPHALNPNTFLQQQHHQPHATNLSASTSTSSSSTSTDSSISTTATMYSDAPHC